MTIKNTFNDWDKSTKVLAVVVAISIFFVFYGVWFESRAGSIDVYIQKRGTAIYLNEKRVGTSSSDDQIIKIRRISPGEHSILVSLSGFFPWEKTIQVSTGKSTLVRTFSMRRGIDTYIKKIQFTNEETKKINNLFDNSTSKISFNGDGNVEIKRDNNKITATWLGSKLSIPNFFCNSIDCNETIIVLNSEKGDIRNIVFYPNRDDLILFSVGENIFAIEIDKKNIQNFQPVYSGILPDFIVDPSDSRLYIKEGNSILSVTL